jgi:hypothetical protein
MDNGLLDDPAPSKQFWLLFKVASKERLKQMQNGLLYMNSLDYFASLKDESASDLRADNYENVHGILRSGHTENGHTEIWVEIGDKKIKLNDRFPLTAKFDITKNIMLFCMGCMAEDNGGNLIGNTKDGVVFDQKLRQFGDHVLTIKNPAEFWKRYAKALTIRKGIFKPQIVHEGCGRVDYTNIYTFSGAKGIYLKDQRYEWQREFRLAIGADDDALNANGALELRIGTIKDISEIFPIEQLLERPIKVTKTPAQEIGGKLFALRRG